MHRSSPNVSPDATGPLPQFSLDDADESFDRAPTLVRPSLDAREAAAVLRAIDRVASNAPGERARSDSLAPVMSTCEVRFFDADAAVAALEDRDDLAESPRRPTIERARTVRRAFFGVLGASLVLLAIASGLAAARPPAEAAVFESTPIHANAAPRAAAPTATTETTVEEKPSSTGVIETRRALAAQTLFVDGVAMGKPPLTVSCGLHAVRVGKSGATSRVDVPCGGSALVR